MKIRSIPEILQEEYDGHVLSMHKGTGFSMLTIAKYRYDIYCTRHVVINGQLMVAHRNSKPIE